MNVRARVTLTVEIVVSDVWGEDCLLSQVRKQATDSALQATRRGLAINFLTSGKDTPKTCATLIGEPKVVAIMVDSEKQP